MKRFRSVELRSTRRINEAEICCQCCPKGICSLLHEQCRVSSGFEGDDDIVVTELLEDDLDGQTQGRIDKRRKTHMEFEVPVIHPYTVPGKDWMP